MFRSAYEEFDCGAKAFAHVAPYAAGRDAFKRHLGANISHARGICVDDVKSRL